MQQKNKFICPKQHKCQDVYVNLNPNSKLTRLQCSRCFHAAMNSGDKPNDYISLEEFIADFGELKSDYFEDSLYAKHILKYAPLFENDIDQLINRAKERICAQLEELRTSMKPLILLHSQLKSKYVESQQAWFKIVGYEKFAEEYAKIEKSNSNPEQWKTLEALLQNIINTLQSQQNDEFRVIYTALDQQYNQLLNQQAKDIPEVPNVNQFQIALQSSIAKCLRLGPISTHLCPQEFNDQIFKKINKKIDSSQLLYKLGQDAKDNLLVQQRINGKPHTLMFIKFDTNQIIGAYTAVTWKSNPNAYIADHSGQSFLFSVSKKEIYSLTNHQHAIYSHPSHPLVFGRGHDLILSKDFKLAYSNMGHTYQIDQYKPVDKTTHLANAKTANIIEFEIYQLTFS